MAEVINNSNPFSSAGHRWHWQELQARNKIVEVVGTVGAAAGLLNIGGRPGVVVGKLKATAATRALADAGMNTLEAAIETLIKSGTAYSWEDDMGQTGTNLKVMKYKPSAPREYGLEGATWICLVDYQVELMRLDG